MKTPVKIGVLHSLTGTMATSERPLVEAMTLAVEQINRAGGVLGRQVDFVEHDGASKPASFAAGAERLIAEAQASWKDPHWALMAAFRRIVST